MIQRLLLFIILILLLLPMAAHAQFSSGVDMGAVQFGQKNSKLKALLDLQNQMQLLKSLIDHERSVNDMIMASVDIGQYDPFIPAPEEELCKAVPANIPCAQSYNSLYENYSVAINKPSYAPPAASLVDGAEIPAVDAKDLSALPEVAAVASPIYWTDITCLGSKCSAVISADPKDPKARYRIVAGEKLPDGSIVSTISAAGVTIERDKKSIMLDPAPQA